MTNYTVAALQVSQDKSEALLTLMEETPKIEESRNFSCFSPVPITARYLTVSLSSRAAEERGDLIDDILRKARQSISIVSSRVEREEL